jgi:O-acetyl-ADP-ribose deacetylase (regulator of RNase III)
MKITFVQGDITEQDVDAIVNAANHTLMGGGGVDGAIHRRGGPEILAECKKLREGRFPDGLPTGQAVATTAGRLKARWVIHTVGPVWNGGGRGERSLVPFRSQLCMVFQHFNLFPHLTALENVMVGAHATSSAGWRCSAASSRRRRWPLATSRHSRRATA